MVKVKINENGSVVTAYAGNAEFGYVVLESEETIMQNGWLQVKSRNTIMRGPTEMLTKHFSVNQTLPGRIQVIECLEDNINPQVASQLQKDIAFEDSIAPFIKRAGSDDAPTLMVDDKRILRFTEYDATGASVDSRQQHTNGDAIRAYNSASMNKEAKLPK